MQPWRKISRDISYMLILGVMSSLLGLVNINIPGIEGGASNLREIPLFIAIFHFSNPLYLIGACFLSVLSTPPGGSIIGSFIMHSISILISWALYNYLKKLNLRTTLIGLIWFLNVLVYYLVFLFPLYILSNFILGTNTEKGVFQFYTEMVRSTQLEMFISALVAALYLIQYDMRKALQRHKADLEDTVRERTEELVSAIEELKTTQHHLIQSSKMASLGTLTAGVSHEINNPLNFITGGLYMIENIQREEKFTSEEKNREMEVAKDLIKEGLERTKNIVKNLEAFSQTGNSVLTPCDIHLVIDNVLTFLNFRLKDITISKDYKLNGKLLLFPEKIHQVIMHIIDNSIYAINSDALRGREIYISTKSLDNTAVVKISNTGPRIPEKHLSQIFDPFFTTKDPGEGPGIGLSICYTLISEHKGEILAVNEPDRVCFIIKLPLNR